MNDLEKENAKALIYQLRTQLNWLEESLNNALRERQRLIDEKFTIAGVLRRHEKYDEPLLILETYATTEGIMVVVGE